MKRILLIAVSMVVLLFISAAAAGSQITVKLEGKNLTFPDAKPYINKDKRTMVPIRFIAENTGSTVSWNNLLKVVTIKKGNTSIELKVGQKSAIVNGKVVQFDTSAKIEKNRTFVPLRFVSEVLGADVYWDGQTNTIFMSMAKIPAPKIKVDYPSKPSNASYYFQLRLDNYEEYSNDYLFKVYFTSHPLNEVEFINPVTEKWEKADISTYSYSSDLYTFRKKYYTTREKNFTVKDNLEIKYILTIYNQKTGIKKEYPLSAVVKSV